jgi:hypothetical protein
LAGKPLALKVTALVKPPCADTLIDAVPSEPGGTVTAAGLALILKFGVPAEPTVSATVVVLVNAPETPVMATVAVAAAALLAAVNVTVVPLDELAGAKLAVTPAGSPLALKFTVPLNPLDGVTLITDVTEPPAVTLAAAGAAPKVKFAAAPAVTVRLIVAVRVRPPPVPVTVSGYVPAVGAAPAVSVNVVPVAELAGEKLAVTPAGRPVTAKATTLENPF